jgi:hypothetical protein
MDKLASALTERAAERARRDASISKMHSPLPRSKRRENPASDPNSDQALKENCFSPSSAEQARYFDTGNFSFNGNF